MVDIVDSAHGAYIVGLSANYYTPDGLTHSSKIISSTWQVKSFVTTLMANFQRAVKPCKAYRDITLNLQLVK